MRQGGSTLNPYAASYVPLYKRVVADVSREINPAQEFNTGNEFVQYGPLHQHVDTISRAQHNNAPLGYAYRGGPPIQTAHEFAASTSYFPNEMPEKSKFPVECEMDIAFLQLTFPGISEESLSDVYQANRCDVDAAVDMLHQLEMLPDDSSDKLPDTLDIGDVPESGLSLHDARNTIAEAGTSSSGLFSAPWKS